ncbi:DGQHR domain-containing protein [Celeribacter sp.]|uniref:DGQHR domain-containing protein n=1 Tax=Celeribacter sp. TaxID=1890673 RepID=UPI003A955311
MLKNNLDKVVLEISETDHSNLLSPLIDDEILLKKEARKRGSIFDFKTVHKADVAEELEKGWVIQRRLTKTIKMKREKAHDKWLEDRFWTLVTKMGYKVVNEGYFKISFTRDSGAVGKKQIDVYAEDDETVLVVECKSKKDFGRRSLQKDLEETRALQEYLRSSIFKRFDDQGKPKPKIVWIYATYNILWSATDVERAVDAGVKILTENEIQYLETFIKHMGPAGKYQILGEFLKGQKVPGLSDTKIPAIKGRVGGEVFYSFVSRPRDLLKIAFINHQALNNPDGNPAYQRMISSSRIKEIGKYIERGGFFPTNILVNFTDSLKWEALPNDQNPNKNIKFGFVQLPAKYRSAWIIDGQHRLYGYSRIDDKFLDENLFVLAFEKMNVEKEADLFITINHKQKSVPKGLLDTLLADMRMGDDDPSTALSALCSSLVRTLDSDKSSPLARRFKKPDLPPEPAQKLTISEIVKGLRRSGLVGRVVKKVRMPGPMSGPTDKKTIARAQVILGAYFQSIYDSNPERWEDPDGLMCINPAIRAHLDLIGELTKFLTHKKSKDFALLSEDEYIKALAEYTTPITEFFETASRQEMEKAFARKFGEGGVKEASFFLQGLIADKHPEFGSDEFKRHKEQSESAEIDDINAFILKLGERMTNHVIDVLKKVHGTHQVASGEPAFWEIGVQDSRVRDNAYKKQQSAKPERRKPKEAYLDIVDLKAIVAQKNNWPNFKNAFNNPREGDRKGKEYYLDWIQPFNDVRIIAAHKNQLKTYTDEDLEFIEWLKTDVSPKFPDD